MPESDAERLLAQAEAARQEEDPRRLIELLESLEGRAVDEALIKDFDRYRGFLYPERRLVASVEVGRRPGPDEQLILFGNFAPSFKSLVIHNPMLRSFRDFGDFRFDRVESHRCWSGIDRIFIINREDRPDRLYSCMRELVRMGAPLDRIERFSACIERGLPPLATCLLAWLRRLRIRHLRGTLGCLRSHLEVSRIAQARDLHRILVVEDDFCFSDDLEEHQRALGLFIERGYDFDVCLLSTTREGLIEPFDDLVSRSRQSCTNTSAYLVSREGLSKLVACFSEALHRLRKTADTRRYAADRCWTRLQGDRFLVFKNNLGFQLPGYSDIEGSIADYLG